MLALVLVLVLETVGALTRRFLPTAWRGAALACGRRPRERLALRWCLRVVREPRPPFRGQPARRSLPACPTKLPGA
jgi:uncharacterized protein YjeT (DUF2065 family)